MSEQFTEDLNIVQQMPIEVELLDGDLHIIAALGDHPNEENNLTSAQLKAKFDEAGLAIQRYINEKLIPAILASDATEVARINAEAQRIAAELERLAAEELRVSAEPLRISAENERLDAERARIEAENARLNAENLRAAAEELRAAAEPLRLSAEEQRIAAETERLAAEELRVANEERRVAAAAYMEVWEPWNITTAYNRGNKVAFEGSSYMCTVPHAGVAPTDTNGRFYWQLIARAGADGGGGGDMFKNTYDPSGKERDVYAYADEKFGLVAGAVNLDIPDDNLTKVLYSGSSYEVPNPSIYSPGLAAFFTAGRITPWQGISYIHFKKGAEWVAMPMFKAGISHFFNIGNRTFFIGTYSGQFVYEILENTDAPINSPDRFYVSEALFDATTRRACVGNGEVVFYESGHTGNNNVPESTHTTRRATVNSDGDMTFQSNYNAFPNCGSYVASNAFWTDMVYHPGKNRLIAVCKDYICYRASSGGTYSPWTTVQFPHTGKLNKLVVSGNRVFCFCGTAIAGYNVRSYYPQEAWSEYFYSDNGGETWVQGELPIEVNVCANGALCEDGKLVLVSRGSSSVCLYTTNNGNTWKVVYLPAAKDWCGLIHRNSEWVAIPYMDTAVAYCGENMKWYGGGKPVLKNKEDADITQEVMNALGAVKSEMRGYTGTGTYGSSNPCSVRGTAEIKAAILVVGGAHRIIMTNTNISTDYYQNRGFCASDGGCYAKKSSDGKAFYWYSLNSSEDQMNVSGVKYDIILLE